MPIYASKESTHRKSLKKFPQKASMKLFMGWKRKSTSKQASSMHGYIEGASQESEKMCKVQRHGGAPPYLRGDIIMTDHGPIPYIRQQPDEGYHEYRVVGDKAHTRSDQTRNSLTKIKSSAINPPRLQQYGGGVDSDNCINGGLLLHEEEEGEGEGEEEEEEDDDDDQEEEEEEGGRRLSFSIYNFQNGLLAIGTLGLISLEEKEEEVIQERRGGGGGSGQDHVDDHHVNHLPLASHASLIVVRKDQHLLTAQDKDNVANTNYHPTSTIISEDVRMLNYHPNQLTRLERKHEGRYPHDDDDHNHDHEDNGVIDYATQNRIGSFQRNESSSRCGNMSHQTSINNSQRPITAKPSSSLQKATKANHSSSMKRLLTSVVAPNFLLKSLLIKSTRENPPRSKMELHNAHSHKSKLQKCLGAFKRQKYASATYIPRGLTPPLLIQNNLHVNENNMTRLTSTIGCVYPTHQSAISDNKYLITGDEECNQSTTSDNEYWINTDEEFVVLEL